MKLLASARNRWLVLAALWVALLVLGIGGFLQQAGDGGFHRTFLDNLYLTLQLAALNYSAGDEALNWRLQVARFVAPVMAASTVLQTASLIFVEQYRQFRLRFASGHTIVCGLGDTGTRIAQSFAASGATVVAIELNSAAEGVAAARASNITVVIGDATDSSTLEIARVGRAARIVCVSGNDATNLQISIAASELSRSTTSALRCAVHLADAELADFLRSADLDATKQIRVTFFNVHERAARTLVAESPPFVDDVTANHVLVLGLGQLGRSLVVALAQAWADRPGDEKLPITLVDRVASGRWEAMCMQHPALRDVCTPTIFDFDLESPRADEVDRLRASIAERAPTWVCMAFEDESLALSTALFAQRGLSITTAPIVVRTRTESGLGALIHGHTSAGKSNLRIFPFLERTCTVAAVDAGIREQLARAVHEQYLADTTDTGGSDLRLAWDDLADDQRDPSRRRVDGVIGDFDALGYALVPLRRWGAPVVQLTDEEVARMAEREHQRWRADREAAGWTWAAVRDNVAKHNPLLVSWSDLSDDARKLNVDAARALPAMLARAGYEPVRSAAII